VVKNNKAHLQTTPKLRQYIMGRLFIPMLCVIYIFSGFIKLDAVPRSFGDESWYAVPVWTLIRQGVPRNPIIPGRGRQEELVLQPKILSILAAVPFASTFGIKLSSFRMASVLFGLFGLLGTYVLSRELAGAATARISTLLLFVNPWFMITARNYRPEIFVLATTTWFFALMLIALRKDSKQMALVGGIFMASALCSHQNAAFFFFCFCLALLLVYPQKGQLFSKAIYVAAAAILGLLPYVIYAIWGHTHSGASFWAQFFGEGGAVSYGNLSGLLMGELRRWSSFLRLPYGYPVVLLYIVALIASFTAKSWKSRTIGTFLVLHTVFMPLIIRLATNRYLTVLLPFFSLLIAHFYSQLRLWSHIPTPPHKMMRKVGRKVPVFAKYFPAMLLLLYSLMMIGQDTIIAYCHRNGSYKKHINEIRKFIPEQAVVCAPIFYWIGFSDHSFVTSNIRPEFKMNHKEPNKWLSDRIASRKPDILLQTTSLLQGTGGVRGAPQTFGNVAMDSVINTVTAHRGQLIATVGSLNYGPVKIWQLEWDKEKCRNK